MRYLELLRTLQCNRCAHCGATLVDKVNAHLDHIVPVKRGGRHERGNLQWLCLRCNIAKLDCDESAYRACNGIPALTPWDWKAGLIQSLF